MKIIENIRGVIPKKEETIESLTNKVLNTLIKLQEIDGIRFNKWYEQSWTKKNALKSEVKFEFIYLSNLINNEWDKKFQDLGSDFSFWSGNNNELDNSKINFRIGLISDNKYLDNNISITLPKSEEFKIYEDDKIVYKIGELLKEIWSIKRIETMSS